MEQLSRSFMDTSARSYSRLFCCFVSESYTLIRAINRTSATKSVMTWNKGIEWIHCTIQYTPNLIVSKIYILLIMPCFQKNIPRGEYCMGHLTATIYLDIFSPANVDASVMYRRWKESKGKDKEYENIIRWLYIMSWTPCTRIFTRLFVNFILLQKASKCLRVRGCQGPSRCSPHHGRVSILNTN